MARNLRPMDIYPITTRFVQVLRTEEVTPGMQRVTLGGAQLNEHVAENGFPVQAFRSEGFDDEFKILIRHPDVPVAVGPTQADGVLDWPRGDNHMLMRTYTARAWRPDAGEHGELDVDFVVHGVGPATSWARKAQPGETVQIAGPKSSGGHPEGADWCLIIGDETALPAIGRWLEEWPKGSRAQVFIEVEQDDHRQDLAVPEGVKLTWLVRDGAEAGTTTLLFDAVQAADWWDGKVFAWAAGEAGTLKPIRRWLKNEKGLGKDQLDITGYWRRQEVKVSEDNPEVQDFEASEDLRTKFHDLAEIVPGFALRVAATIGLGPVLGDSTKTLDELVTATGSDKQGLFKVLRYLEAIDVTERVDSEQAGSGWRLTDLGKQLDDDNVINNLSLNSSHGHREVAAMVGLLDAVRGGVVGSYAETPDLAKDRVESGAQLGGYVSPMVAGLPQFEGVSTVAVYGNAAVTFAGALTHKYPEVQVTVVAPEFELEAYRAAETIPDRVTLGTDFPPVDVSLLTDPVPALTDADAVNLLRSANDNGRLVLFTRVLNPARAHDHDYEHDLQDWVLDGGGARDADDYAALFAAAGLPDPDRSTIGWGFTLHDFG